jgi:hypothetical protein
MRNVVIVGPSIYPNDARNQAPFTSIDVLLDRSVCIVAVDYLTGRWYYSRVSKPQIPRKTKSDSRA